MAESSRPFLSLRGSLFAALAVAMVGVGLLLLLPRPTGAQENAADISFKDARQIDNESYTTTDVVAADFDGDGDNDLIFSTQPAPQTHTLLLFKNGGSATFTGPITITTGDSGWKPTDLAVVDLDDDRLPDLIVAAEDNHHFCLNKSSRTTSNFDCNGTFDSHTFVPTDIALYPRGTLKATHVIVAYGKHGISRYTIDRGATISISPAPLEPNPPFAGQADTLAIGDVDRNGTDDIITEGTVFRFDKATYTGSITFTVDENDKGVGFATLTRSGQAEIVVGNALYSIDDTQNQPTITKRRTIGLSDASYQVAAVIDLNPFAVQSGNLPAEIVAISNKSNGVEIYQASGTPVRRITFLRGGLTDPNKTALAFADLDGDNGIDIVVARADQTNLVYLNNTPGTLAPKPWLHSCAEITALAAGDIDGDGNLDLLAANNQSISQAVPALKDAFTTNQGVCGSSPASITGKRFAANNTASMALADLDADRDLDLVVGDNKGFTNLWRNDGGAFIQAGQLRGFTTTETLSTTVATGDLDGDSDLDIVIGQYNGFAQVFFNNGPPAGQPLSFTRSVLVSRDQLQTRALNLGDLDQDGDLDIVIGVFAGQSQFFLNNGLGSFGSRMLFGPAGEKTTSVALGDVTGDGWLDIVTGNDGPLSVVYYNQTTSADNFFAMEGPDNKVECERAQLYSCLSADRTQSVALADFNHDGNLDVVTGNYDGEGKIYRNNEGLFPTVSRTLPVTLTNQLLVGDFDGDPVPDIAATNMTTGGYLLEAFFPDFKPLRYDVGLPRPGGTQNGGFFATPVVSGGSTVPISYTLFNPDRGNIGKITLEYSLDGGGNWHQAPAVTGTITRDLSAFNDRARYTVGTGTLLVPQNSTGLVMSDDTVLGPIDLGFPFMFFGQEYTQVWISSNGWMSFQEPKGTFFFNTCDPRSLDFDVPLVAPFWTDLNPSPPDRGSVSYARTATTFTLTYNNVPRYADDDVNGPRYSAQVTLDRTKPVDADGGIVFAYSPMSVPLYRPTIGLWAKDDPRYQKIVGCPFRSGSQFPEANKTFLLNGTANRYEQSHLYSWDLSASKLFGQYDNVVLRLAAFEKENDDTPLTVAYSSPFRVRGRQVKVVRPSNIPGLPVNNTTGLLPTFAPICPTASGPLRLQCQISLPFIGPSNSRTAAQSQAPTLVYRTNGTGQSTLLTGGDDKPLGFNAQSYMLGRIELDPTDKLVALLPISRTSKLTVYYSSAGVSGSSLSATPVGDAGEIVLQPTAANALILLNLDVSLQWDVLPNDPYLAGLETDLKQVSATLYDWTNGQAALGEVRIFDGGINWTAADIQILASNRVRPNATVSGLLNVSEGQQGGRVRMGATWNRFGSPGATLGDDWPLALAHELGHYAFGLYDNYLGIEQSAEGRERLKVVATCPGAMTNPYIRDEGEFRTAADWAQGCLGTLTQSYYQGADWQAIKRNHNALTMPTISFANDTGNPGPTELLLDATHIVTTTTITPELKLLEGATYSIPSGSVGAGAQAVLFRCGTDTCSKPGSTYAALIDLGAPVNSQIIARGAYEGDRICVFDLQAIDPVDGARTPRLGCLPITNNTGRIPIESIANWPPNIKVQPNGPANLQVSALGLTPGLKVRARLYPSSSVPGAVAILTDPDGDGDYRGQVTAPGSRAADGYIHVWLEDDANNREVVTAYGLGGSPAEIEALDFEGYAPVLSPDGQVLIYKRDITFEPNQFYALQATADVPSLPPWGTLVGQVYRVTASRQAPDLSQASITFSYLQRDVPANEEPGLEMYYYPESGGGWILLASDVDGEHNIVAADMRGEGLYALISSVHKALGVGWNNFTYNSTLTRPIAEGLASIDGKYELVLTFVEDASGGRWLVYDPKPEGTKTLTHLEPNRGYLIYMTEAATLRLRGGNRPSSVTSAAPPAPPTVAPLTPPAIFSGELVLDTTPTGDGARLEAYVGAALCGVGSVRTSEGRAIYQIVVASGGGCGAPGRLVSFRLDGRPITQQAPWSNERPVTLTLRASGE